MAETDIKAKCYDCKHFVDEGAHLGVCKRFPKVENKHKNDWCGEFVWKLKEFKADLRQFFEENPVKQVEDLVEAVKKRGRKPKNATTSA